MYTQAVERYSNLAFNSARMAASIIDGDRIDEYLIHGVDGSYLLTLDLLRDLQDSSNLTFLYIVRPVADGIVYIFDVDPSLSRAQQIERRGYVADADADVVVMDIFMEVYRAGLPMDDVIVTRTAWGHLASAYVPVVSSSDAIVAVACVDVNMDEIISYVWQQTAIVAAIVFGVFLLSSIIILYFYSKDLKDGERVALERERAHAELDIARNIQMRMLPSFAHPISDRRDFDIYACMDSKREVGGDFYDAFFVDDDVLAVVIGNVTDKSISAALLMSSAMMLIRNSARMVAKAEGIAPNKVFESVNDIMFDTTETNISVSAFMGYLDLTNGEFTYVNAGYNPPLVKLGGGGYGFVEAKPSVVLTSAKNQKFEKNVIHLGAGDALCLYSDSVVDAANNVGEFFSNQGLLEAANNYEGQSAQGLIEAIQENLNKFTEGAGHEDDIVMLALRYVAG